MILSLIQGRNVEELGPFNRGREEEAAAWLLCPNK